MVRRILVVLFLNLALAASLYRLVLADAGRPRTGALMTVALVGNVAILVPDTHKHGWAFGVLALVGSVSGLLGSGAWQAGLLGNLVLIACIGALVREAAVLDHDRPNETYDSGPVER